MKKIIGIIISFILIFSLASCHTPVENDHFERLSNGDYIDILLYDAEDKIAEEILSVQDKYFKLLDSKNEYEGINNLASLNKKRSLSLDKEVIDLLKYAENLAKELPTVSILYGKLRDLWIKAYEIKNLPTEEEYKAEITIINNSSLLFSDDKVSIVGNANIDIDFFAKAFILTKIKEVLNKYNIDKYVINYNGEAVLYGKNQKGKYYESAFYGQKHGTYKMMDTSMANTRAYPYEWFTEDGRRYCASPSIVTGIPNDLFDNLFVSSDDIVLNAILSLALFNSNIDEVKEIETKYNVMIAGYRDRLVEVYKSDKLRALEIDPNDKW